MSSINNFSDLISFERIKDAVFLLLIILLVVFAIRIQFLKEREEKYQSTIKTLQESLLEQNKAFALMKQKGEEFNKKILDAEKNAKKMQKDFDKKTEELNSHKTGSCDDAVLWAKRASFDVLDTYN